MVDQARRTVSRRNLERNERFSDISPDVGQIDIVAFDELMATSAEFRGMIFQSYSKRITDLLQVVEEVAFRRIDLRLAGKLLNLAGDGDQIVATQSQIATELGTVREVVSRQFQEFQRRGWVKIGRGTVTITDKAALTALANSDRAPPV